MSASDRSTDSSKKLISLLLILLVILVLFVTIIGMGSMLYDFSRSTPPAAGNNTSIAADNTHISLEGPLSNIVTTDDITRTSLLRSMKLLLSTGEGDRWLANHSDWRLFKAQADYVDGSGLAKYWNLVIMSQDSVLIAYVDNGVANVLSIEDNSASDQPPLQRQILLDSNYLVNNVTTEKGISPDNSTHFSFVFNDDETGGIYKLGYTDPVNSDKSFTQIYSAKNGEAIEDTI